MRIDRFGRSLEILRGIRHHVEERRRSVDGAEFEASEMAACEERRIYQHLKAHRLVLDRRAAA